MDSTARLVTVEEAAGQLNVKVGTLYSWIYAGLVPHVRILAGVRRALIRLRQPDLDRFIAERLVASKPRTRQ